MLLLTNNSVV